MQNEIPQFSYHIGWRSRGGHAGRHASTQRGMGMEFRGHTTLLSYPDPRRIDIRLTIRDPLEQVYVRVFNQKSATPVFVAVDMSGSMNYGQQQSKMHLAATIAQSVAISATNNHDPFGLIGFDDVVREDWLATSSFRPHHALSIAQQLQDYRAEHIGNQGLSQVHRYLPRERSLVFLISDFHMPLEELKQAITPMLRHHVVPIVLWDDAEYKNLPEFGITNVSDCETGERKTLFLRKSLRARIIQNFEARRSAIHAFFMHYDMPPFFVQGDFDANALTDYFHQFVAA